MAISFEGSFGPGGILQLPFVTDHRTRRNVLEIPWTDETDFVGVRTQWVPGKLAGANRKTEELRFAAGCVH
jgi:hypothetical protein